MAFSKKVEITGVNTATLPILNKDRAFELFERAKDGDLEAREELISGNLRLVLSIVKRFDYKNENTDDLFQVGCIGLMKGIDNFDTTLNVLPSTYLVPMIIGEIRRYLRDNNSIRVSRSLRDIAYKALQSKEMLQRERSEEPSIDDIAKDIGFTPDEIKIAIDAIQEPTSLNEPLYNNNGDAFYVMDQISDTKETEHSWLEKIAIQNALKRLTDREKNIISLRFFEGKTQMEVSDEIGISQAQVSRLEKSALKHMRKFV